MAITEEMKTKVHRNEIYHLHIILNAHQGHSQTYKMPKIMYFYIVSLQIFSVILQVKKIMHFN